MTLLFSASAAVLAYTYVGYPLLVAVLARVSPAPETAPDPSYEPTVTACVPVYNGEAIISAKIETLLAQEYPADKLEVLVFSDGSTDRTEDIVREVAARDPRVRLLASKTRVGKPTALNRMRAEASGEVLLLTDARQALNPGATRALVGLLAAADVGCVSGNLEMVGAAGSGVYWRYEKWIRETEARFRSLVGVSGALYVIRREDMVDLPADVILDDMWVPMRLRLAGRRILFCRDAKAFDEAFEDDREFSRKVRTLAGNFQLFGLLPDLLSPTRNPSYFETVSHKVTRLVGPFALAGLLVGSAQATLFGGPITRLVGATALSGQLAFYGLAFLGPRAKKLGSIARTFVVMNAAAAVGLYRHAGGAQRVTW